MVTTRRQIDKEEDRYGGYEQEIVTDRDGRTVSDNVRRVRESRSEAQASVSDRPVSVVRPVSPRREGGYDRTIAPTRPSRYSEVMPEVQRKTEAVAIVREQKLTAGTKKMLIVYLALVLTIVTAIIITGVVASGIQSDIDALESGVEEQVAALAGIDSAVADAYDDAVVWAEENMVPAGPANTYDELVPGNAGETSGEVFDSIRDWVNSVFGG